MLSILFFMMAAACDLLMDKWMIAYMLNPLVNKGWWSFNPRAKWENGAYNTRKAYNVMLLRLGIKSRLFSDNCNDAWHFFKFLMVLFVAASGIVLAFIKVDYLDNVVLNSIMWLVIYGIAWNATFSVLYKIVK